MKMRSLCYFGNSIEVCDAVDLAEVSILGPRNGAYGTVTVNKGQMDQLIMNLMQMRKHIWGEYRMGLREGTTHAN